jgi:hypothetical protein
VVAIGLSGANEVQYNEHPYQGCGSAFKYAAIGRGAHLLTLASSSSSGFLPKRHLDAVLIMFVPLINPKGLA